jgi:hypothetical protein
MNGGYADTCKFCGTDIKWVQDDGTDDQVPPIFSAEVSNPQDGGGNKREIEIYPDQADLDDINNQLEDIKAQISHGVKLFDVNMPFSKMVALIIKLLFASIPAVMIVGLIILVFWIVFGGLLFNLFFSGYGVH